MNLNPFDWFKKEEKPVFPSRFALVRLSSHAKERAIDDEENKIVEIYSNGKLEGTPQPYSEELVNALEEVDEIPVIEEVFDDEPYEFEESEGFGFTQYRR